MQSIENNKLAKNTLFLYIRMFLTMGISLYTSRVVLNVLGVNDYGIYNVVGGFVFLFGFINNSMTSATQRFLTVELGKKGDVNTVFSTSVSIHIVIALIILILCESIGIWFLYNQMQMPSERLNAAFWTFQCSILSTCVMIVSVPYNAVIIAYEKMSAFAYIASLEVFLKLVIAFIISFQPYDNLIAYAVLMLVVQIIVRFCYSLYCNKHFPNIKFSFRLNMQLIKKMISFAGWTLSGNLAMMGYTQGLNILLNVFFGPIVNAARGIAVQVQNAVIAFCSNFMVAVKPQIVKSYSQGNLHRLHKLVITSSKFSFYLLLCITLPLIFSINSILQIWLGNVPQNTNIFLIIILCSSMIRSLADPLITSIHATGDIRKFQLVESSLLICILPVSYVILLFHFPPYSVFIIHLIFEVLTQAARIKIVLPKIKFLIKEYLVKVIYPIMKVILISPILPFILYILLHMDLWWTTIALSTLSLLSVIFSVYFLGLSIEEKDFVVEQIHKVIYKIYGK